MPVSDPCALPTTRGASAARRLATPAALLAGLLLVGCGGEPPPPPFTQPTAADVALHGVALGEIGRFEFDRAVPAFEAVLRQAPGWHDARVNLAIALLNTQEEALLDRAVAELGRVLGADPAHARALYVLGLIRLYRGDAASALPLFQAVAAADPDDPATHYWVGFSLQTLERYPEAVASYRRCLELDPYVQNAWYGAFQSLQALDRHEEAQRDFDEYRRLEANPLARSVQFKYSRMGAKGLAQPGALRTQAEVQPVAAGRRLGEAALPLAVRGRPVAWAAEPGPLTQADVDGDGRADLFLVGAEGQGAAARGLLLHGAEGGGFEARAPQPFEAVTEVNAACFGDLDNDGRVDLVLCRRGPERVFLQREGGRFEDVTAAARLDADPFDSRDGLLADLDHDGDLDLYLVNRDGPNAWFVNNLDGTFRALGKESGLAGDGRPSSGVIAADLDADRDLDLVLLHADPPHEVFWNERLWSWRRDPGPLAAFAASSARRGVAADAHGDGLPELYVAAGEGVTRWARSGRGPGWAPEPVLRLPAHAPPTAAGGGSAPHPVPAVCTQVAVADLDGDGRLDLVGGGDGVFGDATLVEGRALVGGGAGRGTAVGRAESPARASWLLVALLDPRQGPVLLRAVRGGPPELLAAPRAVYGFAGLELSGKHKQSDQMRSNASGLGVRAVVHVGSTATVHATLRPQGGPGQSLAPVFAGLGPAERLDFVTLLWPDGLLQTEVGLERGRVHRIEEVQRQTSSCPVLFCWDGSRHAFVTDLLGVGGVGFWVAPATYAPPLPRENLLLPAGLPVAREGRFVFKLGEPMEETCYLDGAALVAYDLPPGVGLVLDERLAVNGPAPTGEPRFVVHERLPVRALDGSGADVTAAVLAADRRAAPSGPLDGRFLGRTHGSELTLEFDAPLDLPPDLPPGAAGSAASPAGPLEPLLVLDGWIEYPYASTMFAAWQAGAEYRAPSLWARGADGVWALVAEQWGYPAGMPRTASLPLPPLPPGTRALRLTGTYEVYWDRVSVAWARACPQARRHALPRAKAVLQSAGFARRTTGPQRLPHYDWERRLPLWDCRHQRGLFTRLGDVEALLAATDDALVVFGPGEEVHLEFEASLPSPPPGFTRRFVLETTGWCKDMDLATKDGDTVGPLPLREGTTDRSARDRLHAATLTRPGR